MTTQLPVAPTMYGDRVDADYVDDVVDGENVIVMRELIYTLWSAYTDLRLLVDLRAGELSEAMERTQTTSADDAEHFYGARPRGAPPEA
jgi:hypothetical protein